MGIFDKIKGAIFGGATAAPLPPKEQSIKAAPTIGDIVARATAAVTTDETAEEATVDVAAVLERAASSKDQKLKLAHL